MTALMSTAFRMRPFGQTEVEQDYQLLHVLSHYQAPQDPEGNREWLENRRSYDEAHGTRRHAIAVHTDTQAAVGYAALEQQGPDPRSFRLYLVFNPNQWSFRELGEFMYQHLLREAQALGATRLACVEYANDLPFLAFLGEHGFARVGEASFNGFAIVRMEIAL
jgi:L-amino acid N-acyltransferase YncA